MKGSSYIQLSTADYYAGGLSSEMSSSYPGKNRLTRRVRDMKSEEEEGEEEQEGEDEEEELELGLSLGTKKVTTTTHNSRSRGGSGTAVGSRMILTAKDFPSMLASMGSPISSSSSSSVSSSSPGGGDGGGGGAVVAGTKKRAADSVGTVVGYHTPSPVVGWPPIRAYRMNSLVNQSKDHTSHENNNEHHKKASSHTANIHHNNVQENVTFKEVEKKGLVGKTLFVKVNMDGVPIGRKVDLNAHHSYETLALALEEMFQKPGATNPPIRSAKASKLLDSSFEFALTYEDKDGDWMLVGDVPWGMFLSTVKRLRIMRTSDANGLAPRFQSSHAGGLISNAV